MFNFLKDKKILGGIFLGAFLGYLYYSFFGCVSGNCMITSNAIGSTLYGGLMGGLIFSMFKPKENPESKNKNL